MSIDVRWVKVDKIADAGRRDRVREVQVLQSYTLQYGASSPDLFFVAKRQILPMLPEGHVKTPFLIDSVKTVETSLVEVDKPRGSPGSGPRFAGANLVVGIARMFEAPEPREDRPGQPVYVIDEPPSPGESGIREATTRDLDLLVPACAQAHFEEIGIDPLRRDPEGFRWRTQAQIGEGRSQSRVAAPSFSSAWLACPPTCWR